MKTLIENSILVKRTGKGNQVKTIFNSTETESQKYFNISELSGKRVSVEYSYTEDSVTKFGSPNLLHLPNISDGTSSNG